MALSGLQKTMISTGIKQLHKWISEEKNGKIDFSLAEINNWLTEEGHPFSVKVAVKENKTEVRLECKK